MIAPNAAAKAAHIARRVAFATSVFRSSDATALAVLHIPDLDGSSRPLLGQFGVDRDFARNDLLAD
jgi:hypothetical protein